MSVATQPAPPVAVRVARAPSAAASLLAIVRRGLRDHRRAPLTWGGSLGALCAFMASIWPSIEGSINDALESYPQALKDAFNIRHLTTVEQYIDAEMLSLIVPLAVAVLAVRIVTRAIAGAEEQRYLDTLLAAPVSRRTVVAGSFFVAGLVVAGVLAVTTLLTWVAGLLAGADPSLVVLARGTANVWPLSMLFAGTAALAAGRLHGSAMVTAIATAVLAAMYVIDLLGKVAEAIEPLRWASAFRYYGSAIQDGIDPLAFAGLTVVGLALTAVGGLLFERRDVLA
jgi:ABC-2 type transport system permease protein